MKKLRKYYLPAILNSYSMVFFSQHKFLAVMLFLVTFFHPLAGFAGLISVLFTVFLLDVTGHQSEIIKSGIYSFNSLLLGVGFGTFYQQNAAFFIWLTVVCLFNILLTVNLYAKTGKIGLPVLSLPFIVSFYLILLAANNGAAIGLMPRNLYLWNDIFAATYLKSISLPFYADLFFRSLSAVLFQNSLLAGVLMSVGILVHSRIAFSLLLLGFASACLFNYFTAIYPQGISYYLLGANFMMVALTTGGFFLISSARSFGWSVLSVCLTFPIILALGKIFGIYHLPLFSLPFCVVSFMLIGFFRWRAKPGKVALTPLQHYSPETNLYFFLSHQKRLANLQFLRLKLPFLGSWTVSQGYQGKITHLGDWAEALDFVIADEDQNTFRSPGTLPEHFYCFNKPVLACADGKVEEVVNDVEDNAIGAENLVQNWGNTVILKHADGLYSKVSHLKKSSVKVAKGDEVKAGNVLGLCGNSGRSPEPHLHFQLQKTPYIGSKTLKYPFAYYVDLFSDQNQKLKSFQVPAEKKLVKNVDLNFPLKKAFDFKPGFAVKVKNLGGKEDLWEVFADAQNQHYLYCKNSSSAAYFVNDGTAFYFSSFYGDKNSMLYYFFLAAYRVVFTSDPLMKTTDEFPLSVIKTKILWLQDFVAPFYRFLQFDYENSVSGQNEISISSFGFEKIFKHKKQFFNSEIQIENQKITGFTIHINGKNVQAKWLIENIY